VTQLFVVLDDVLFLVPLDALPLGEGRVGDTYRITQLVSLARSTTAGPAEGPVRLLALGDVAYDGQEAVVAEAGAPSAVALRGIDGVRFDSLPGTAREVERLAELFDEAAFGEATLLLGNDASKARLLSEVRGADYVHVATHGWFAREWSVAGDALAFAPLALCGVALAGANEGRDALGRVPGVLTAEELASLQLADCRLAVLSACETNVGLSRPGEGILSLQAALHAAGARATVTSLWEVDDGATQELMEGFYRGLWLEGLPPGEALWSAKAALRASGAPLADWAGWILSGRLDLPRPASDGR